MPVLELDMLIAFVNAADHQHASAIKLFEKITRGREPRHQVATSAYLEYELVHRSKGLKEAEIFTEISSFQALPHLGETGLTTRTILRALLLREDYPLTYFDSLHAGSALLSDGRIVSADQAYDQVEGLTRIEPPEI